MNCAFIISPSYSGSTLLSMLLAHHPGVATLGEFLDNHARRYRSGEGDFCSCGQRLPECPYLEDLAQRVRRTGIDFSVDFPDTAFHSDGALEGRILRAYVRGPAFELARRFALAAMPGARREVKRVVERNTSVIGAILEKEGARVYLDSAKNNNRVLFFHRYAPRMDVRVIWLVRDGRGVTTSIMRHRDVDVAVAARRWATTQRSVIRTVRALPSSKVMHLRYEDLCAEPARWLDATCNFLGLDPAELPQTYGDQELHLTGNNMRLKGLSEIRQDERWRERLSQEELATFASIGGALNGELGYD